MFRFLWVFIFGLCYTYAEVPNMDMMVMPTVSAYAKEIKKCDVNELDIGSLDDLKVICSALVESEVCKDIDPEYLLNCDDLYYDSDEENLNPDVDLNDEDSKIMIPSGEYELHHEGSSAGSILQGCVEGLGYTARDIAMAVIAILTTAAAGATELFTDAEWSSGVLDQWKVAWLYLMEEQDRMEVEGDFVVPFLSPLISTIWNAVESEYAEFGCLNGQGKWSVMCQFIGDAAFLVLTGGFGVAVQSGALATKGALGIAGATVKGSAYVLASPFIVVSKTAQGVRAVGRGAMAVGRGVRNANPVGRAARGRRAARARARQRQRQNAAAARKAEANARKAEAEARKANRAAERSEKRAERAARRRGGSSEE